MEGAEPGTCASERPINPILQLLGGLRSSCTYVGAAKLKELSKRTTFIRVTQQASAREARAEGRGYSEN